MLSHKCPSKGETILNRGFRTIKKEEVTVTASVLSRTCCDTFQTHETPIKTAKSSTPATLPSLKTKVLSVGFSRLSAEKVAQFTE